MFKNWTKNPYFKYLTKEDRLQRACIDYAMYKHGMKPIALNTEHKRSNFEAYLWVFMGGEAGTPDLFFPYPNSQYHGCFMELKTEGRTVFKKNGDIAKSGYKTHKPQFDRLEAYRGRGYYAEFVFGFNDFKTKIDSYALQLEKRNIKSFR